MEREKKNNDLCLQCDTGFHQRSFHNSDGCCVVGCSCTMPASGGGLSNCASCDIQIPEDFVIFCNYCESLFCGYCDEVVGGMCEGCRSR